jgi:spore coat polysaccharide biosynthesis protein SpsF (cytidylyltransferase family)
MSVDTYVRKAKINNSDYNNIANLPYKDQIEIFRTRSLNKYKQLNQMQSNKKEFQQAHETRRKKQNMEELKIIQEAENKLENRMKLRSAKNIS